MSIHHSLNGWPRNYKIMKIDAIIGISEKRKAWESILKQLNYLQKLIFSQSIPSMLYLQRGKLCGYLPLENVRDKDGNAASLAFTETLSYLKSINIKPLDFLDKLYQKYGYHYEKTENIYFEGLEGSEKIKSIMISHRKSPWNEINGLKVVKIKDFSEEGLLDEEDMPIAKENFLMVMLENGFKIAIRPSGTEPKN